MILARLWRKPSWRLYAFRLLIARLCFAAFMAWPGRPPHDASTRKPNREPNRSRSTGASV
jgi:hypothetical protein